MPFRRALPRHAGLTNAAKVAGPAQRQVGLGDAEPSWFTASSASRRAASPSGANPSATQGKQLPENWPRLTRPRNCSCDRPKRSASLDKHHRGDQCVRGNGRGWQWRIAATETLHQNLHQTSSLGVARRATAAARRCRNPRSGGPCRLGRNPRQRLGLT